MVTTNVFIYYYFKNNIRYLESGFTGSSQKKINTEYIQVIKIPVPQLEVQAEFVMFYEAKEQKLKELQQDIDSTEQYLKWLDDLGRMVIENTICKEWFQTSTWNDVWDKFKLT